MQPKVAFHSPDDSIATNAANRIPVLSVEEEEVNRQMQICNACRYCEGFCAVFPAMTKRLVFNQDDIHYLANLCHNCGNCLNACQYAPPHEFGVNVPQAMAKVRGETYAEYATPQKFGKLYRNNGITLALATTFGLALFLIITLGIKGTLFPGRLGADFYAIFPHNLLAAMFSVVFLYAIGALAVSVRKFWKGVSTPTEEVTHNKAAAAAETAYDALTLKYLDGGHSEGCNNESDRFTLARRRFHHFTMYGFLLCFAATCVATLYHFLFQWEAPYPIFSLPVMLGILGGIGLLIGPAGLLWLNLHRNPIQGDKAQRPMDRAFILLLLLVALTGLVLLAARETGAMALLLAIHLGAVMAFFLTMPYGKFCHGIYRCAALFKFCLEKRQHKKD